MKLLATLFASAFLGATASAANPIVLIKTTKGDITVELNQEKAPLTVENFLKYAGEKHYDGTIFHRVIDGFMIQGGGFAQGETPTQKASDRTVKNEAKTSGLSNLRGTLAMARTNDPDSASAQFFINVVDNKNLDAGGFSPDGYAVFGKVTAGMDTVDKIKSVKTDTLNLKARAGAQIMKRPFSNVPVEPVVIESITVSGADAPAAEASSSSSEGTKAPAGKE
jgi:peptidyl-prolyl cis-trans isomerase A (cyclophilin A)